MRSGRDPTRRNKKIGTRDHAWRDRTGGSRPFEVPWPRWERRPEQQRWPVSRVEQHECHGRPITVAVERLLDGHRHLCEPSAIVGVLNELPADDVDGLGLVVLHQETRKQTILKPAWGRILWCDRFRGYRGPVVMIDAIDLTYQWFVWGASITPPWQRELDRFRRLGVAVEQNKRGCRIDLQPEPLRRWQLARTVPHEVGHWVDFRAWVLEPLGVQTAAEAVEHPHYGARIDYWCARSEREREEFADRYADHAEQVILRHLDTHAPSA